MLDNTKDPIEILDYSTQSTRIDCHITMEQANIAWNYLQRLKSFCSDVKGIRIWAQNLIPGNIEAQKIVDELDAALKYIL